MLRPAPTCAITVCLICLGPAIGSLERQATVYVDDDAPGDPGPGDPAVSDPLEDGSPEHPFDAIQEAIDAAIGGDTVLVLNGTYTGDGNRDLDFGGRLITVKSENGPAECIIDCEGSPGEGHRGFNFVSGESADAVVEGFTIQNGVILQGAGLYAYASHPTVRNCWFIEDAAMSGTWAKGGAIYGSGSNLLIEDCRFIDNEANEGGAVSFWAGSPSLTRCFFSGNSAYYGGTFSCWSSTVVLTDCRMELSSGHHGGAIHLMDSTATLTRCTVGGCTGVYGGGIMTDGGSSTFEACVVTENTADYGGGVFIENDAIFTACVFLANRAHSDSTFSASGGAIYNSGAAPMLDRCFFGGNAADFGGGGLANLGDGSPTAVNCLFAGNAALDFSGEYAFGGGIFSSGGTPTVINSTFVANVAPYGAALACGGLGQRRASIVTVANAILWDAGNEIYNGDESSITVAFSDVRGGWPGERNRDAAPGFVGGPGGRWSSEGVYDPASGRSTFTDDTGGWLPDELVGKFVNPDVETQYGELPIVANSTTTITVPGDFAALGTAGASYQIRDYRLLPGSPCIDAGDNTAVPSETPVDFAGSPRFADDPGMTDIGNPPQGEPLIDLGAFEFQGQTCFGDLDRDRDVDLADLATLLANYDSVETVYSDGDLDRDEDVDLADLAALLAEYGTSCP